MAKQSTILEQIATAKKELIKLKSAMPTLFPEYNEYRQAERDLRETRLRFVRAKNIWEQLGK